jgi:23S rRNA (cytidine2498-2'-O)-methyltransferase
MGAWTLLDATTMILSPQTSSPFPAGEIVFAEDRSGPPSRAYLKLWEALTLAGKRPGPGDFVYDAGASPGGWTWALASLGAQVFAVDRAPLAPAVAAMPGVSFMAHDAFTLTLDAISEHVRGAINWICCDVACYPPRLAAWIESLLAAGYSGNIVATIKMQGGGDFETPLRLAAIPGSRILHLWHNKHELTFFRVV